MKKLITLDDAFFRELKKAFLPESLFMNDMHFIRFALAFALDQKKARHAPLGSCTPGHGTG